MEKQIPEQAKTLGIPEEDVVKKVMLGNTVTGEFTTLDDVAGAALFFASQESKALTGQSLIVSHGIQRNKERTRRKERKKERKRKKTEEEEKRS